MGCRCKEKKQIQSDIKVLNGMLDSLSSAIAKDEDIGMYLSQLSADSPKAITTETMDDLQSVLRDGNVELEDFLKEQSNRIKTELDYLDTKYTSYESEDKAYHDAKKRRR